MEELRQTLIGKNTLESARILANEFVKRFGSEYGSVSSLMDALLPKGRACSWSMLDRNISIFCKQFYAWQNNKDSEESNDWERDREKLEFLDKVRFLLGELPHKRDYKLNPDKAIFLSPEHAAEHFVTCSLCWRSVLKHPLEKTTPLCHTHDLPSTHSEYRKRQRLKKYIESIRQELLNTLPPLTQIKLKLRLNLNSYVHSLCTCSDTPLPHLYKYLQSLGMPLTTGKDILYALESPIAFNRLSKFTTETWEYYLNDRGEHIRLTYTQLLTAEAWLRVESEHTHGGKRR